MAKWSLKRTKVNIEKMAEALFISPVMAAILANRGIGTLKGGRRFIDCKRDDMYDPYLFKDMDKGIKIISEAVRTGKKIAVYGDYDVDGVMSITILFKALSELGADVIYYVPHRQKEGYGLNIDAVKRLKADGVDVLLTCDNGIAAIDEIKEAKALGMEVVVIDHHEPPFTVDDDGERQEILPDADAIIDHKVRGCTYPYKNLCAAAISYKFSCALYKAMKKKLSFEDELLVFAAIATVCDIVELLDENRIIVKNGLEIINNGVKNAGLRAIISSAGLNVEDISEYHFGFVIGPAINSTGRLESARMAIELFKEEDFKKALEIADELVMLNIKRKDLTIKAADEITADISAGIYGDDKVLVIYKEGIHESVAGIVASRVKEKFNRPVIVITDGEGYAKGSARSIEGYNIFEELNKERELFVKFGGHAMAAGLSLEKGNIPVLRERLNSDCPLSEDMLIKTIRVERILDFRHIDISLARDIKTISPFGKGNPKPVFASLDVTAEKVELIGKNKNILKFTLKDDSCDKRFIAVSFDGYENYLSDIKHLYGNNVCCKILNGGGVSHPMDVVYSIDINKFNHRETVQLIVQDIRLKK
ncbi:MAG: single-stranded-DNA-specific exonuclease RecJ [Lachnospiraceae bacterium]|nr:single-stranded-DNA-specific exonuclease RecJ [Lachnospiraceae bacterium]